MKRKIAKKKIADLFLEHRNEIIYPSDIVERLNLNYSLVEELFKELEDEGQIERRAI